MFYMNKKTTFKGGFMVDLDTMYNDFDLETDLDVCNSKLDDTDMLDYWYKDFCLESDMNDNERG